MESLVALCHISESICFVILKLTVSADDLKWKLKSPWCNFYSWSDPIHDARFSFFLSRHWMYRNSLQARSLDQAQLLKIHLDEWEMRFHLNGNRRFCQRRKLIKTSSSSKASSNHNFQLFMLTFHFCFFSFTDVSLNGREIINRMRVSQSRACSIPYVSLIHVSQNSDECCLSMFGVKLDSSSERALWVNNWPCQNVVIAEPNPIFKKP